MKVNELVFKRMTSKAEKLYKDSVILVTAKPKVKKQTEVRIHALKYKQKYVTINGIRFLVSYGTSSTSKGNRVLSGTLGIRVITTNDTTTASLISV